ncbi:MAG: type II toxin-antitoxin system prevent-host-death family antitoxin [Spirochaetaceae bacterium]|nr:type II toxin-antitoxin system prevent-host-death family antitoxin [Spirochaetaceae bacterium]
MVSIGIRELRQRASEFLRRVEAGKTFEVTNRGRPVALLSRVPDASPLERLRSAGDVVEAQGSMDDAPPPLPAEPGAELPSARLASLREDER